LFSGDKVNRLVIALQRALANHTDRRGVHPPRAEPSPQPTAATVVSRRAFDDREFGTLEPAFDSSLFAAAARLEVKK
jgi:hypothetical protein